MATNQKDCVATNGLVETNWNEIILSEGHVIHIFSTASNTAVFDYQKSRSSTFMFRMNIFMSWSLWFPFHSFSSLIFFLYCTAVRHSLEIIFLSSLLMYSCPVVKIHSFLLFSLLRLFSACAKYLMPAPCDIDAQSSRKRHVNVWLWKNDMLIDMKACCYYNFHVVSPYI